jgi:signal transduction histidine kinase
MIFERIHPDDAAPVRAAVDAAMQQGTSFTLEHRIVRSPGDVRYFHVDGRIVRDHAGKPVRLIGAGQDITDRREADIVSRALLEEQTARVAAEVAGQRAGFLAEASKLLGSSFDYQDTIGTMMKLAVPRLADFATFDMLDAEGTVQRIAVVHVEKEKEALLWQLRRWLHVGGPMSHHLRDALFDGKSVYVPHVTAAMIAGATLDEEHSDILRQIIPESLMTVALFAGGEIRGALALYSSKSGRRFTLHDLALAEELARRASLAVENARLFEAAGAATRARDQMLGIVAHDLRNPLGTIRMAADLLGEVLDASSPAHKQVAMVTRAVDRMNRLIGDLLDVKRLENGRLSVELRRGSAIAMITESVEMLRVVAAASGLELVLEAPAGLPDVSLDANRIQQVLSNLVGNAIKFTPKGGRITLRGAMDGDQVRVSVTDTGSGIPPAQVPHIFDQFWQGSKTDKRGIGLGLSIARGIVEAHGGRIWAQSALGVGTSFHFTLAAHREPVPVST